MADDDWNDLGAVWQEKSDVDVSALTQNVRAKTTRMYAVFIFEMLICAIGAAFGAYWMVSETQEFTVGLVFFLFSVSGGYLAWWARKGAWHAPQDSALDELKFARKRAEAGIRYARVNLWMSLPAFAMSSFILWHRYDAGDLSDIGLTRLIIVAVVLVVFLPICAIGAYWYKGKKTKEVADLDHVISAMEQE